MRKIDFSRSAQQFQQTLPAKHRNQIAQRILGLQIDVHPPYAQSLRGYDGLWRMKAGEYRVVYRYDDETIFIELIGKRNDDDIYKSLRRLM